MADVGDINQPGVRAIIDRLQARGERLSPEQFVDACLDLVGPLEVSEGTRSHLVRHAEQRGDLRFERGELVVCSEQRLAELLQLIVASREYQMS